VARLLAERRLREAEQSLASLELSIKEQLHTEAAQAAMMLNVKQLKSLFSFLLPFWFYIFLLTNEEEHLSCGFSESNCQLLPK